MGQHYHQNGCHVDAGKGWGPSGAAHILAAHKYDFAQHIQVLTVRAALVCVEHLDAAGYTGDLSGSAGSAVVCDGERAAPER